MRGEEDGDGGEDAESRIARTVDPEYRAVEQEVAERAAAHRRQDREEGEPDDVELRAAGGQRAGHGEDEDRGMVEDRDGIHPRALSL